MKKKGFTLIELLIVIAVIAILAAVVAPNALSAIDKSKVSRAESDYKAIKTGVLNYYSDTAKWPTTPATANADPGLVTAPTPAVTGWNGSYLEKWPQTNAWAGEYQYFNPGAAVGTVITETTAKYLRLTNVTTDAAARLETDLDGGTALNSAGIVRNDGTYVYLIISTK